MPAQTTKVIPAHLLDAAASVAAASERAAAPQAGVVPVVTPASPVDGTLATISGAISTKVGQMSAEVAGKGPQMQAKASAGVAHLQAQDAENASQIQAVGDSAATQAGQLGGVPGGTALGSAQSGLAQAVGFKTSLGDGWDDDPVTEAEQIAPPGWSQDYPGNWSPPVMPIGGGAAGGGGAGRAPI
jgi:hypothetical protein